jgi:hypothetical protein
MGFAGDCVPSGQSQNRKFSRARFTLQSRIQHRCQMLGLAAFSATIVRRSIPDRAGGYSLSFCKAQRRKLDAGVLVLILTPWQLSLLCTRSNTLV